MAMEVKGLSPNERIIFALDVADYHQARAWVKRLRSTVTTFKIGLELFTSSGPPILEMVKEEGGRLMLDLKLHDIPTTVKRAVAAAISLEVDFLTLHTLGGFQMMREAALALAAREWPKLLGVTILTSLTESSLREVGLLAPMEDQVLNLATLAKKAGLHGVVASPLELRLLRKSLGEEFLLVAPGIRPSLTSLDDQARAATPGAAIRAGADFLVVGRPVREAPDPLAALDEMVTEIKLALVQD